MSLTVQDGEIITQPPGDKRVYTFDYDAENLPSGVTIDVGTFTITAIKPSTDTALTKDNEALLTGSRKVQLRLLAGTLGAMYRIDHHATTNESPAQEKTTHFFLRIQR